MISQPSLFELQQAALDRVEKHADLAWLGAAISIVYSLSQRCIYLTADDIWVELNGAGLHTHEPRAMGAVLRYAKRKGWLIPTNEFVPSHQKQNHGRSIRVWRCVHES